MDIEENTGSAHPQDRLKPYLSPLAAWALAFGCAVGWGAFVMPGTVFLPIAGPLGVVLGMTLGAAVMLVIGYNYHYMMNRCPDAGGTYAFVKSVFGYDHGFLGAWYLLLVFIAIIWANATALPLVFRNILGNVFQVGFHYQVAGFNVYFGEVLLALFTIYLFGFICMRSGALAALAQTLMAIVLLGGVLTGFSAACGEYGTGIFHIAPAFPPDTSPFAAVLGIMVLAPWSFAGFESISNSAEEFRFSHRKTFAIMAAAVGAGALSYIFLSLLAASSAPKAYGSWLFYLQDLEQLSGLAALPTFHAIRQLMGTPGLLILCITIVAGVVTGLVGNTVGASRLIYSMARDNLLPEWFARQNSHGIPGNAILFILLISLPIPFFGRTAISWIVDVNTIGATIAYVYTSAAAFRAAWIDGHTAARITGAAGCLISALFFLYFILPGPWSVSVLATESYLILIAWSILGFAFLRYIFLRDGAHRFGRSTITWIALLAMIFLTSILWLRQSTQNTTRLVLDNLGSYYVEELDEHGAVLTEADRKEADHYLEIQMETMENALTKHNILQIVLISISLFFMFNIYNLIRRREQEMEVQKVAAEQSSRAKSTFFFNMSHDIRTPMNAIIGYTALAKKEQDLSPKVRNYLEKIEASGDHLLSLINDILEMSRIENGKMTLEIARSNLSRLMEEVYDLFANQMEAKGLHFTVDSEQVTDPWVMCDANRLNRILLNLISNAYKFTPEGGTVTVTLRQLGSFLDTGSYELRVKDSGMGMTEEFVATVFDAYSRDRTASGIQGTGLGMSITKNILELMGGTIEVTSEEGKGTEFIIRLNFELAGDSTELNSTELNNAERDSADFGGMRILLVEDIDMNREIATMILSEAGFLVDSAENGKAALDKVAASRPGYYRLILMDVQMPVMNGYEASKAIRSLPDPSLANLPIIAMTANAFSEDVQNAKDAGMDAHVAKPLDVPKMMATIEQVLKEHRN